MATAMPLGLGRPALLMETLPSGFIPSIQDSLVVKMIGSACRNYRRGHLEDCKEPQADSEGLWEGWRRESEQVGRGDTASFETRGNMCFDHWSECSFLVNKCTGPLRWAIFFHSCLQWTSSWSNERLYFDRFQLPNYMDSFQFQGNCTGIFPWTTEITACYRAEKTQTSKGLVCLLWRVHLEQIFYRSCSSVIFHIKVLISLSCRNPALKDHAKTFVASQLSLAEQ